MSAEQIIQSSSIINQWSGKYIFRMIRFDTDVCLIIMIYFLCNSSSDDYLKVLVIPEAKIKGF